MRTATVLAACILAISAPVAAQPTDADTARLVDLLRHQSARLDLVQRRLDAQLPPTSGYAWIDVLRVVTEGVPEPILDVQGWGLTCDAPMNGGNAARVVAVIDGIETPDPVEAHERPDVKAWADGGYCTPFGGGVIPLDSGVGIRVPLRVLTMTRESIAHVVVLRVYDLAGRFADSPPAGFMLPIPAALLAR